jgi:acyl-CoA reductase-like NAD-dependent aldehyde dehydrogenase
MSKFGSIGLGSLAMLALSATAEAGAAAATDAALKSGESGAAAPASERQATKDDSLRMVESHKAAMAALRAASKAMKNVRTAFRTNPGGVEEFITALGNDIRLAQAHYNDIDRAPKGVTPKGRASRQDLVRDITGVEAAKDVRDRIKATYVASGLSE